MVKLDTIVTRGGDRGETSLADGSRVAKSHRRIAVFGALDEANTAIGFLRVACAGLPAVDRVLAAIQNDLFDIGAELAAPPDPARPSRLTETYLARLDSAAADWNARLAPLTSFILPGGTEAAARAHLARTAARRAERELVALAAEAGVSDIPIPYLNRLSDVMFILARLLNDEGRADTLWRPGGA
ncbi:MULTISPECIES: cob(I)yrinic acid a,c-diamide adenosyltransferase [Acidiphilium]|jgi:cob(I)alamin adenosyltransferase|uniref:Corrinoid adenosyltransferase n=2 Tax=Acidiphilium TaxID=522 RepID=A5FYR3_ACICJ|nr:MULTISPECIES: cob(I)yrinic acid a,c-diamide adenosyltransferase [Acidiphilium]MDE2326760.1 cob(I)yrinic acid a,c-diamide adenosyltransferase [Rhodospirillales bacterium]ABQ30745.1 ATP:cob(I)alamin adenosyltransferase [Acidiphilium cryptum JF-5]EGO94551.1 ATP--cobalamin adenosyltransferase [Acidiphilium sp. PM]KDM67809.1 ATP--cobalamin adenosyltransferase [Acidiphilium sp. JA12-A1]MBS3024304.1 cob(I)yrinic acid a,c-diamide adenosyltransferase [Acidiphilium multivorum]